MTFRAPQSPQRYSTPLITGIPLERAVPSDATSGVTIVVCPYVALIASGAVMEYWRSKIEGIIIQYSHRLVDWEGGVWPSFS